jgi:hypothetical protein
MELSTWLAAVAERLGVADHSPTQADVQVLLDLARDSAHEVERVAAPLTTFLAGVAVGRGADLAATAAAVVALLDEPAGPPS